MVCPSVGERSLAAKRRELVIANPPYPSRWSGCATSDSILPIVTSLPRQILRFCRSLTTPADGCGCSPSAGLGSRGVGREILGKVSSMGRYLFCSRAAASMLALGNAMDRRSLRGKESLCSPAEFALRAGADSNSPSLVTNPRCLKISIVL